jgi:hypothetical protein
MDNNDNDCVLPDIEQYVVFTIKNGKAYFIDFLHSEGECMERMWEWIQGEGKNVHDCHIKYFKEMVDHIGSL